MKRHLALPLLAALALAAVPAPARTATAARHLTILYSADERGEVTPCG